MNSTQLRLNRKTGIVTGFLLIVWGLFTAGIQVYILAAFSSYGDGDRGQSWTDAYNGMAIASGGTSILLGSINMAVFSIKNTTRCRIIFLLVITTLGACGSVASIVLTALESDLLNYLRHPGSAHPCANKSTTNRLTEKQCTDWLALEVTVSILSGLAFCCYFILLHELIVGLAMAKKRSLVNQVNTVGHNSKPTTTEKYFTASRPPSEAFMGHNGPYQAFADEEELNAKYKNHLQQISLQQRAIDEMLASKSMVVSNVPSTPVILSSSVSMASYRGQAHYASQQSVYPQYQPNSLRSAPPKTAKPIPTPVPPSNNNNVLPSYASRY